MAHRVGDRCKGGHAENMGDSVVISEAVNGGYCGGYMHFSNIWKGCMHTPHETRAAALECTEKRLNEDLERLK